MTTGSDIAISTDHASRTFRVPVRDPGLRASIRSVVRRRTREVRAVEDVSFEIARGEVVGFLGPNGAGKTTTLKLLSGLLHPTSGTVRVLDTDPARRDHALLRRISLVMGQRQQLAWDIPPADSFDMLRVVFGVDRGVYRSQIDELVDLLGLQPVLDKPVRQLSLGERMKCELAAALIHRPEILFLDEPTLGLDVQAQRRVREFISRYAERSGATVLLTSHYMADIEALAERVLVIHHGRLQFDGALKDLAARTSDRKLVTLHFDPKVTDEHERIVEVQRSELRDRLGELLDLPGVIDFTVEKEPIERVMERVFESTDPTEDRADAEAFGASS